MNYETKAGKLVVIAMALIAVVILGADLLAPGTARAAYEYGYKQTDGAGSAGSQQTARYMSMTSPNTDNIRVISYGLNATLAYTTRFCLYIGDAGINNNATKIASSETTAVSDGSGWQWFDLPTPYDMPKNSKFGVGWKKNNATSGGYYYLSGGTNGNCDQFFTLTDSPAETTAFVSPITGASTYAYVYSFHVVYVLYPTVSTNPTSLDDATAGYTLTGTGFEGLDEFTSQGQPYNSGRATTSEVWLTQNNNWASPGTKVAQTITAWNNTDITFTSNFGALTPGTTAYLWVENSDGEHTGTGIPVTLNSPSDPSTYAGTVTGSVVTDTQIDVSMPFVGDFDNDGSCTVEYNTADSWPGTAAPCSPVTGASPRSCSISGLTAGNTYYVRVTYNDPDGVSGTATQVLGPYVMQLGVIAGSASAVVDSGNQITVSAPFTGDVDEDSSTQIEYNTSNSWPGTVKCASITSVSPRVCVVNGLTPATDYWFRITHSDLDGVTGTNPEVIGPYTTDAVPTVAPTVTLITPSNWPSRDGTATFPALKQKVGVVVYNSDSVGLTVDSVTLDNGAGGTITGWGTVNSTAGTYGPVLPGVSNNVITWTGPFNIPARGAVSFYCEMMNSVGSASTVDYTMTATVYDSVFTSTAATVPISWSHRQYASGLYAYMGTESAPVYCVGEGEALPGGTPYAFNVEFRVPENVNTSQNRYNWSGPASTTQPSTPSQVIRVSIPAGWTNVTATATQGIFNGVNVTGNSTSGWNIYGSVSPGMAMGPAVPGSCGDFVTSLSFNATPPSGLAQSQGYIFQINYGETNHSLLIEDASDTCTISNFRTNRSACDLRGGFMVLVDGGDISPPANVSSLSANPSDNQVSLDWVNPTTDEGGGSLTGFDGVIILVSENALPNQNPVQGVSYSVGNAIGNSWVRYIGTGTSFVQGDPCGVKLNNGSTYYYKAYSFDSKFNYSSGNQVSAIPLDSTPPADVTGISVTPGDRKNTITWTNPSDCDFSGVHIQYSTSGFPTVRSDVDPAPDGSHLAGNKLGGTPGAPDSFVHQSLTNGTPYYYTLWTHDDEIVYNWSTGASPGAYSAPKDTEAPGQITDLSIVPGSETAFTITLQWSSPADSGYDGSSGNASKYYLRFYDQPITDANWTQAWNPGGEWLPQPIAVGSNQTYTVTGLSPLHDYYFALRTSDEVGNMSSASNNPVGTTLCNEALTACDQCHQMPPQDGLPGSHPRATGNIGKHTLPIHAGAGEPEVCNVCHANGNVWRNNTTLYGYNHQNFETDINDPGMIGNKKERDTQTGGTFVPYTEIVYKFEDYSSGVGYKQVTGYCAETYCHGAGLSSPRWGIDTIVCGEYCHETPPATGKHVKHYHPGQHYVNFGPTGTLVSGYDLDDGTVGWSGTVVMGDNGSDPNGTPKGNRDDRYRTYLESGNTQKTFVLPAGNWYITVCVGDSDQVMTGQTVRVSGDGGSTWTTLIENFDCRPEKHFDKTVDHPFTVTGSNDMILQVGNGTDPTRLNYMIVNSTPEAPKTNNTILQNTASAYGFNCGKCHTADNTQTGHTGHVNSAYQEGFRDAEIHFDANSFPKNPMGNYTAIFDAVSSYMDGQGFRYTLGAQCADLYCHGSTLNAGGSNPTPTWEGGYIDVEGASLCGACHEAGYADTTPLTNMDTGSHDKHVSSAYAYRVDCYKCHNHTTAPKNTETGKIAISDKTHHVNGDVDAVFDPNDNTMKFGRYSTSLMTCFEVYCHSNGLLKNNQPYWATEYAEPVWGSGSKSCNYCHGTTTTDGHPAYANVSTRPNSHAQHREANGIGCSMCHYDTTRDNGLTVYTTQQPSLHVNGTRNVTFDKAIVGASAQFTDGECTNTYCHGLSAPPTWGSTDVQCGTCHGDGLNNPNPGVGNHFIHNNGAYDLNSTVVTNASDAGNYNFSCRFCHFSRTHGGGQYISGTQTAEVNFNDIDAVNGYNNAGAGYATGGDVFIDPVSGWEFTNGNCQDLSCHSDGRGGQPNNTFFTWTSSNIGSSADYNCDGCHSGTAVDTYKMSSGSHDKHVWASVYRRNCHDCHYETVFNAVITDKSKHVNANVEVTMSPAFGGSYSKAAHECSNVFCHSNGDPALWNGPESDWHVFINWTSTEGTNCLTCHSNNYYPSGDGVRTGNQTLSRNHGGHLSNYASRIGCTNCHNETAATNASIQPTVPSVHNNGKKNIAFYTSFFNHTGMTADMGGYWGAWQESPVDGFCTVFCHSNGNAGNPVRFPNWSSVNYGCNSCHGAKGSLASGSHTKHVTLYNIGCGRCHNSTSDSLTADAPTINASGYSTNHVDGEKDVVLTTGTWNPSPTLTCSTTGSGCHGSNDSPVWGTTVGCIDCHGTTGADVDDYDYYSAPQAMINTTEYTASGHGRTSAYPYTGNAGANLVCESCHGSRHAFSTNPFRLISSVTIMPSQPDTLCLSCHSAVAASHDYAHVGQGNWTWTPKCVDCHDPHGDTAGVSTTEYNGAMIQREVSKTASNTYGVPGTTEVVDFPANFTVAQSGNMLNWSSFVVDTGQTNKGICRVCHTDSGVRYFTFDTYSSHNSGQGACTSCHTHESGFKPSACNACHGNPPNITDNKADNVGAVGAHDLHATTLDISCVKCHGHYGSGSQHNETSALAGYSSLIPAANVDLDVTAAPDFHGAAKSYNGVPGAWDPVKTCSNVGCHYGESKGWDCQ